MSIVVFYLEPESPQDYVQISKHYSFNDDQLGEALKFCAKLRSEGYRHVCMSSEMSGQVGGNGVKSVEDGKLPDGSDYTWMKRRSQ